MRDCEVWSFIFQTFAGIEGITSNSLTYDTTKFRRLILEKNCCRISSQRVIFAWDEGHG